MRRLPRHGKEEGRPGVQGRGGQEQGQQDAAVGIVAKMKDGKGHPKVAGSDDELKAAVESALK
jgi:hypothetical protein